MISFICLALVNTFSTKYFVRITKLLFPVYANGFSCSLFAFHYRSSLSVRFNGFPVHPLDRSFLDYLSKCCAIAIDDDIGLDTIRPLKNSFFFHLPSNGEYEFDA